MVDSTRRAALLLGLATPALSIEAFAGEPEDKPRSSMNVKQERIAEALEKLAKEVRTNGVGVTDITLSSSITPEDFLDQHKLSVEFFLLPDPKVS